MKEKIRIRLEKELKTTRSRRRRALLEERLGWSRVEVAPEPVVKPKPKAKRKKAAKKD
jgi:hypothetical protein|tara:strand:+ start:1357 stop:1530 length:174 start_codon:yes stop_codon:yes gene_type:complete